MLHSVVLTKSGNVFCFGDNTYGQLGIGKTIASGTSVPQNVIKLQNIVKIASNHHSAAISEQGDLYFWGTGVFGTFYEPQIVKGGIVDVSIGGSFGILRDKEGLLWSWGQNDFGELGQNDTKARMYPNPISALKRKNILKLACGGQFAISIGQSKADAPKLLAETQYNTASLFN